MFVRPKTCYRDKQVKKEIFKPVIKVGAKRKHYNNKFKFKFRMLLLNAVGVKRTVGT